MAFFRVAFCCVLLSGADGSRSFKWEDHACCGALLQDFFSLATIAALLWLVFSAYSELEKIH